MSKPAPHSPMYSGSTVISAVDWLGNRFLVGDKVIYCISAGRGQLMAIGEVIAITVERYMKRTEVEAEPDEPDALNRPWLEPDRWFRIIKVPSDEVKVQVRTLKTSGKWDNAERKKPAWVNPQNITALQAVGQV